MVMPFGRGSRRKKALLRQAELYDLAALNPSCPNIKQVVDQKNKKGSLGSLVSFRASLSAPTPSA
jgi:hypothetical protein